MPAPEELVETALRAADAAAHQLLLRAEHPWTGVGSKSSATDLVGDADRAAERAIGEVLDRERPADGRIAEEGGARRGPRGCGGWSIPSTARRTTCGASRAGP